MRDHEGALKCQPSEVDELRFFAAGEPPRDINPPSVPALTRWARERAAGPRPS